MGGPVYIFGSIVGLNVNLIPHLNNRSNLKKINAHISLIRYIEFITYVINHENIQAIQE
jgi:hypothetical protein